MRRSTGIEKQSKPRLIHASASNSDDGTRIDTSALNRLLAGFGMLTQVYGRGRFGLAVVSFTLYSLGLASVFTLVTDMIVGGVRAERAGAASAISETGSELGGALGIAVRVRSQREQ